MAQHLVTSVLVLASASCTVLANLLLKLSTQHQGIGSIWPLTLLNARVAAAASAFGMAFIFYAMILKRLPLSMAQAILSMQFVLVILAAYVLLDEQIGLVRWLGIALMAVGLVVIGFSPDTNR